MESIHRLPPTPKHGHSPSLLYFPPLLFSVVSRCFFRHFPSLLRDLRISSVVFRCFRHFSVTVVPATGTPEIPPTFPALFRVFPSFPSIDGKVTEGDGKVTEKSSGEFFSRGAGKSAGKTTETAENSGRKTDKNGKRRKTTEK